MTEEDEREQALEDTSIRKAKFRNKNLEARDPFDIQGAYKEYRAPAETEPEAEPEIGKPEKRSWEGILSNSKKKIQDMAGDIAEKVKSLSEGGKQDTTKVHGALGEGAEKRLDNTAEELEEGGITPIDDKVGLDAKNDKPPVEQEKKDTEEPAVEPKEDTQEKPVKTDEELLAEQKDDPMLGAKERQKDEAAMVLQMLASGATDFAEAIPRLMNRTTAVLGALTSGKPMSAASAAVSNAVAGLSTFDRDISKLPNKYGISVDTDKGVVNSTVVGKVMGDERKALQTAQMTVAQDVEDVLKDVFPDAEGDKLSGKPEFDVGNMDFNHLQGFYDGISQKARGAMLRLQADFDGTMPFPNEANRQLCINKLKGYDEILKRVEKQAKSIKTDEKNASVRENQLRTYLSGQRREQQLANKEAKDREWAETFKKIGPCKTAIVKTVGLNAQYDENHVPIHPEKIKMGLKVAQSILSKANEGTPEYEDAKNTIKEYQAKLDSYDRINAAREQAIANKKYEDMSWVQKAMYRSGLIRNDKTGISRRIDGYGIPYGEDLSPSVIANILDVFFEQDKALEDAGVSLADRRLDPEYKTLNNFKQAIMDAWRIKHFKKVLTRRVLKDMNPEEMYKRFGLDENGINSLMEELENMRVDILKDRQFENIDDPDALEFDEVRAQNPKRVELDNVLENLYSMFGVFRGDPRRKGDIDPSMTDEEVKEAMVAEGAKPKEVPAPKKEPSPEKITPKKKTVNPKKSPVPKAVKEVSDQTTHLHPQEIKNGITEYSPVTHFDYLDDDEPYVHLDLFKDEFDSLDDENKEFIKDFLPTHNDLDRIGLTGSNRDAIAFETYLRTGGQNCAPLVERLRSYLDTAEDCDRDLCRKLISRYHDKFNEKHPIEAAGNGVSIYDIIVDPDLMGKMSKEDIDTFMKDNQKSFEKIIDIEDYAEGILENISHNLKDKDISKDKLAAISVRALAKFKADGFREGKYGLPKDSSAAELAEKEYDQADEAYKQAKSQEKSEREEKKEKTEQITPSEEAQEIQTDSDKTEVKTPAPAAEPKDAPEGARKYTEAAEKMGRKDLIAKPFVEWDEKDLEDVVSFIVGQDKDKDESKDKDALSFKDDVEVEVPEPAEQKTGGQTPKDADDYYEARKKALLKKDRRLVPYINHAERSGLNYVDNEVHRILTDFVFKEARGGMGSAIDILNPKAIKTKVDKNGKDPVLFDKLNRWIDYATSTGDEDKRKVYQAYKDYMGLNYAKMDMAKAFQEGRLSDEGKDLLGKIERNYLDMDLGDVFINAQTPDDLENLGLPPDKYDVVSEVLNADMDKLIIPKEKKQEPVKTILPPIAAAAAEDATKIPENPEVPKTPNPPEDQPPATGDENGVPPAPEGEGKPPEEPGEPPEIPQPDGDAKGGEDGEQPGDEKKDEVQPTPKYDPRKMMRGFSEAELAEKRRKEEEEATAKNIEQAEKNQEAKNIADAARKNKPPVEETPVPQVLSEEAKVKLGKDMLSNKELRIKENLQYAQEATTQQKNSFVYEPKGTEAKVIQELTTSEEPLEMENVVLKGISNDKRKQYGKYKTMLVSGNDREKASAANALGNLCYSIGKSYFEKDTNKAKKHYKNLIEVAKEEGRTDDIPALEAEAKETADKIIRESQEAYDLAEKYYIAAYQKGNYNNAAERIAIINAKGHHGRANKNTEDKARRFYGIGAYKGQNGNCVLPYFEISGRKITLDSELNRQANIETNRAEAKRKEELGVNAKAGKVEEYFLTHFPEKFKNEVIANALSTPDKILNHADKYLTYVSKDPAERAELEAAIEGMKKVMEENPDEKSFVSIKAKEQESTETEEQKQARLEKEAQIKAKEEQEQKDQDMMNFITNDPYEGGKYKNPLPVIPSEDRAEIPKDVLGKYLDLLAPVTEDSEEGYADSEERMDDARRKLQALFEDRFQSTIEGYGKGILNMEGLHDKIVREKAPQNPAMFRFFNLDSALKGGYEDRSEFTRTKRAGITYADLEASERQDYNNIMGYFTHDNMRALQTRSDSGELERLYKENEADPSKHRGAILALNHLMYNRPVYDENGNYEVWTDPESGKKYPLMGGFMSDMSADDVNKNIADMDEEARKLIVSSFKTDEDFANFLDSLSAEEREKYELTRNKADAAAVGSFKERGSRRDRAENRLLNRISPDRAADRKKLEDEKAEQARLEKEKADKEKQDLIDAKNKEKEEKKEAKKEKIKAESHIVENGMNKFPEVIQENGDYKFLTDDQYNALSDGDKDEYRDFLWVYSEGLDEGADEAARLGHLEARMDQLRGYDEATSETPIEEQIGALEQLMFDATSKARNDAEKKIPGEAVANMIESMKDHIISKYEDDEELSADDIKLIESIKDNFDDYSEDKSVAKMSKVMDDLVKRAKLDEGEKGSDAEESPRSTGLFEIKDTRTDAEKAENPIDLGVSGKESKGPKPVIKPESEFAKQSPDDAYDNITVDKDGNYNKPAYVATKDGILRVRSKKEYNALDAKYNPVYMDLSDAAESYFAGDDWDLKSDLNLFGIELKLRPDTFKEASEVLGLAPEKEPAEKTAEEAPVAEPEPVAAPASSPAIKDLPAGTGDDTADAPAHSFKYPVEKGGAFWTEDGEPAKVYILSKKGLKPISSEDALNRLKETYRKEKIEYEDVTEEQMLFDQGYIKELNDKLEKYGRKRRPLPKRMQNSNPVETTSRKGTESKAKDDFEYVPPKAGRDGYFNKPLYMIAGNQVHTINSVMDMDDIESRFGSTFDISEAVERYLAGDTEELDKILAENKMSDWRPQPLMSGHFGKSARSRHLISGPSSMRAMLFSRMGDKLE